MSEFKRLHTGWSNAEKQAIIDNMKSQTLSTLIPAYSTSIEYSIGQYVVYSGALYRCIGTTTGAWDSTKWESATLEDLVDDVNGAVADVAHKANIDGYYSTMGVGHADSALSLDSNVGNNDETPFNYQTAGGTSDITTGIQNLKKLVGASVVFNQLAKNTASTLTLNGITFTNHGDGSWTLNGTADDNIYYQINTINNVTNHKVLFGFISLTSSITGVLFINGNNVAEGTGTKTILTTTSSVFNYCIRVAKDTILDNVKVIPQFHDLTQMFGSQVADYIYAKEQANAGDGVAIFKSMFPNVYYAYNTGTFIHSQSAKLKMVDYNQWDEEWELGSIESNGQPSASTTKIRSKNFNECYPNTTYYFYVANPQEPYVFWYDENYNFISFDFIPNRTKTSPNNAHYFKIRENGTTYNNDICISLYWDGSRIGYEPYQEHIYELPNDELKGILKVVDNKIVADGDEEYPDGTSKGNYTLVDLSTLTFVYLSNYGVWRADLVGVKNRGNAICDNYYYNDVNPSLIGTGEFTLYYSWYGATPSVFIKNGSDTTQPSGNLLFQNATPTETTSTAFTEYIHADDFGTMEFLDENNERITGIQGNEIFYEANISAFAESLYVKTNGDVDEIVTKEDISDEALATRGYIKLASITGYDATKTQVLKNVNGTFTWVDET